MEIDLVPVYHLAAAGTRMIFNLFIYPALDADFLHKAQIIYYILMVHYAVLNMHRNKCFKAFAGEISAFIAARYSLFLRAYPKSVTAVHAMFRHSVGKASFALLRERRAGAAKKPAYSGKIW
ncbi:MAG: hypothetical protein FWG35_01560 [Spirochaetaceae bacterium]|nr:hypothetical protein [Spirochaetaceae bacterium]